jgi:hypothetical protein
MIKEKIHGVMEEIKLRREQQMKEGHIRQEKVHVKKKMEKKALFEGLIDLAQIEGKPAYLIKKGDELYIYLKYPNEGKIYIPPEKRKIPFTLPRASEVMRIYQEAKGVSDEEFDRQLFKDLVDYFKKVSKLPEERYYELLAIWVMHTYLIEHFEYSPNLSFYAVAERGKTRTGKGIVNIAYRGITIISLNEAYIFRGTRLYSGTMFFDIRDLWHTAKTKGSLDILLGRFQQGSTVPRVVHPELGDFDDTEFYPVFGPTVFASNESIDYLLESRSISIQMPEAREKFDDDILKPINTLPLKERLVVFRARHIKKALPEVEKPIVGRLGDILRPLGQIIHMVCPEKEASLNALFGEIEKSRRGQNIYSLEARILMAIQELYEKMEYSVIPVKAIANKLNEDSDGRRDYITCAKVGRKIRALGFDTAKTCNGSAGVLVNRELMDQLLVRYGFKESPDTPETSVWDTK